MLNTRQELMSLWRHNNEFLKISDEDYLLSLLLFLVHSSMRSLKYIPYSNPILWQRKRFSYRSPPYPPPLNILTNSLNLNSENIFCFSLLLEKYS